MLCLFPNQRDCPETKVQWRVSLNTVENHYNLRIICYYDCYYYYTASQMVHIPRMAEICVEISSSFAPLAISANFNTMVAHCQLDAEVKTWLSQRPPLIFLFPIAFSTCARSLNLNLRCEAIVSKRLSPGSYVSNLVSGDSRACTLRTLLTRRSP